MVGLLTASSASAGTWADAERAIEEDRWEEASSLIDDLMRERMSTRKMEEVDAMRERVDYELARTSAEVARLDAFIAKYRTGPYIAPAHELRCALLEHQGREAFTTDDLGAVDAFLNGGCPEGVGVFTDDLMRSRARAYADDAGTLQDLIDRFPNHALTPRVHDRVGEILYAEAPDEPSLLLELVETYRPAPWIPEATKRADELWWNQRGVSGDFDAVIGYLAAFPDGAYRPEATVRRNALGRGAYSVEGDLWAPFNGPIPAGSAFVINHSEPITALSLTAVSRFGEPVVPVVGWVDRARAQQEPVELSFPFWQASDSQDGPITATLPCVEAPAPWVAGWTVTAFTVSGESIGEWSAAPLTGGCTTNLVPLSEVRNPTLESPLVLGVGFADEQHGPASEACPFAVGTMMQLEHPFSVHLYSGSRNIGRLELQTHHPRTRRMPGNGCGAAGWTGRFLPTQPLPPAATLTNTTLWGASGLTQVQMPAPLQATRAAALAVVEDTPWAQLATEPAAVWFDMDGNGMAELIAPHRGGLLLVDLTTGESQTLCCDIVAWQRIGRSFYPVVLDSRPGRQRIVVARPGHLLLEVSLN